MRSLEGDLTEVSACTLAIAGYVMQTRTHSGPVQDVACGIEVSIKREATVMAFM